MKFCNYCGAELRVQIPPDDHRPRHVCTRCAAIHYQNPKIVAGCAAEADGRILLCKRSIEPRSGLWTLPAGFMELGETTAEAAARETLEEANARVAVQQLYTLINLPQIGQVYMIFRARLLDLDFSPGRESSKVCLFDPDAIPWEKLAFPVIQHTLRFFVEDVRRGVFPLRTGDIVREGDGFAFRADPAAREES